MFEFTYFISNLSEHCSLDGSEINETEIYHYSQHFGSAPNRDTVETEIASFHCKEFLRIMFQLLKINKFLMQEQSQRKYKEYFIFYLHILAKEVPNHGLENKGGWESYTVDKLNFRP